jgi:hypothetical protein
MKLLDATDSVVDFWFQLSFMLAVCGAYQLVCDFSVF